MKPPRNILLPFAILLAGTGIASSCARAQMKTGERMKGYFEAFGIDPRKQPGFSIDLMSGSAPGNILYPGEQPELVFQVSNREAQPLAASGRVHVIAYGTRGIPGDVWTPEVFRIAEVATLPVRLELAPRGVSAVTLKPEIPERFGGYALVFDFGGLGSRFGTSLVRTFPAATGREQYPRYSLDRLPTDVLARLGVRAIRYGVNYVPSTSSGYQRWRDQVKRDLEELNARNITVLLMFMSGVGPEGEPLGRPRPHLDERGVMLRTKSDMAWLPSLDPDFEKVVADLCSSFGWPRGPVTAVSLWNEPWDGISISGWGADIPRYREIFSAMAEGVESARKTGVQVLIGGCDSSSNTWDKLFSDGRDDFLKWLDVCTIHYEGLDAPTLYKAWLNRRSPYGRVRIWDTESWTANTDDRVAPVIAGARAAGYDRVMGVFGGNIAEPVKATLRLPGQPAKPAQTVTTWSLAAAVGAAQHFMGERPLRRLLFKNGLPWIFVFDGLGGNADDGTAVVVGDLSDAFDAGQLPFREVTRAFKGGALTLAADPAFRAYDFYGNRLASGDAGAIRVPLDHRGVFLRTDQSRGSFSRLLASLSSARIEGYDPVEILFEDPTAPFDRGGAIRLRLTNVLNRPVHGELVARLGSIRLRYPPRLEFGPHETKEVAVCPVDAVPRPDNTYRLGATFDAGPDGRSTHDEDVHVDFVARRTIAVDGDLSDWKGVIPQTVRAEGESGPTLAEAAWYPFAKFDRSVKSGVATGYFAYDEHNFYFAAKIGDDDPDGGTFRFGTLDPDRFFYPEASFERTADGGLLEHRWPEGVRRYSYRTRPVLPSGDAPKFDNVQLAFGIRGPGEGDMIAAAPGTMPGFVPTECTDYEYALNTVAPAYGGGTEVWRLLAPGMPRKQFYPREPRSPLDGPVAGARLVVRQEGNTRIVEAALPWTEMPLVKAAVDAGRPVRLSFRVNAAHGPPMELAQGRSIAPKNPMAFHADWIEHWSNALEFGFER